MRQFPIAMVACFLSASVMPRARRRLRLPAMPRVFRRPAARCSPLCLCSPNCGVFQKPLFTTAQKCQ
jgi:hypothetical protein